MSDRKMDGNLDDFEAVGKVSMWVGEKAAMMADQMVYVSALEMV